jgi:hypothetical protein
LLAFVDRLAARLADKLASAWATALALLWRSASALALASAKASAASFRCFSDRSSACSQGARWTKAGHKQSGHNQVSCKGTFVFMQQVVFFFLPCHALVFMDMHMCRRTAAAAARAAARAASFCFFPVASAFARASATATSAVSASFSARSFSQVAALASASLPSLRAWQEERAWRYYKQCRSMVIVVH